MLINTKPNIFQCILFNCRFPCLTVLAHTLIYQHDKYTSFEAQEMVDMYLADAYKACTHAQYAFASKGCQCQDKLHISTMLITLEKMAKFFAQNAIWINLDFEDNDLSRRESSPSSSEEGSPTRITLVPR